MHLNELYVKKRFSVSFTENSKNSKVLAFREAVKAQNIFETGLNVVAMVTAGKLRSLIYAIFALRVYVRKSFILL